MFSMTVGVVIGPVPVAAIIGDAILSPLNSFRTALRNFGVG
jgi:hypothetical protein